MSSDDAVRSRVVEGDDGCGQHEAEGDRQPADAALPSPLTETIAAVAVMLEDARDPWWIISSAAAAIHGAYPITVGDVDVLLSARDAAMLFTRLGFSPAPASRHSRFRSALFGRWTATPLTVEFMAGFRLRDRDGVWREVQPQTRVPIRVGGATVFIPALHELRDMFERFGRLKDRARVDLIDPLPLISPRRERPAPLQLHSTGRQATLVTHSPKGSYAPLVAIAVAEPRLLSVRSRRSFFRKHRRLWPTRLATLPR